MSSAVLRLSAVFAMGESEMLTRATSVVAVTGFRIRAVQAPLDKPHKTASGTISVVPLVLLDVRTDAGVSGSAYVFVYTPMALRPVASLIEELEMLVKGEELAPSVITSKLEARFRLLGNQGIAAIAVAAIDMALWDALARLQGLPLARLLGGTPSPVRVYDSLGQMEPDETAREVEASLACGFRAFKVKAGHADPTTDVNVIKAIRRVGGPEIWVAADFNQAFSVPEAVRRIRQLEEVGLDWIEEPARAEDYAGHAAVKSAVSTPVQTGENWWGIPDMTKAIAAGASDFVMLDVMKIGGVSGWLRAAALAAAHQLPASNHLFAEISTHLLAVTPTAHMLEWFDIAKAVNSTPVTVKDGMAIAYDGPGCGINWNEETVEGLKA